MKITHAQVQDWSRQRGLEPVQVNGIPEGFSFKEPDITINGTDHIGDYVAYIPLSDWQSVRATSIEELQAKYNTHGKRN